MGDGYSLLGWKGKGKGEGRGKREGRLGKRVFLGHLLCMWFVIGESLFCL